MLQVAIFTHLQLSFDKSQPLLLLSRYLLQKETEAQTLGEQKFLLRLHRAGRQVCGGTEFTVHTGLAWGFCEKFRAPNFFG